MEVAPAAALPHARPMGHNGSMLRRIRTLAGLSLACAALVVPATPASAAEEILQPASYSDLSTYKCQSAPLTIQPGQNLNLYDSTTTCPNAQKLSGPGAANPFTSSAQGYITRFEPNMVWINGPGGVVTPRVDDLHLHHVVWLRGDVRFAAGEEKTYLKLPQGYGYRVPGNASWGLNWMIHDLLDKPGRLIRIEWIIDWVPVSSGSASGIEPLSGRWMDVAGDPQIYPVFDAEKGFANTQDGKFTFPDEVPQLASEPGYEERAKISNSHRWTIPSGGVTLIFLVGHTHPGGIYMDVNVTRDGVTKKIFRSDARYYEPAGAVSWDVSMKATRPEWRVKLKAGDLVSISATYDVTKGSWYESMGIVPVAYVSGRAEPNSADPFDAADANAFQAMIDAGGILTHGRLPENVDDKANKPLGLADPRKLKSGRLMPSQGVRIWDSFFTLGGFSAIRGFPASAMLPPVIRPGRSVTFTSLDALANQSIYDQTWHTITSCAAPCNRGSGIGYPLAGGPVKFDSGQLGFANSPANQDSTYTNIGVVENTNVFTTPRIRKAGTYSYFCRIHPYMRGSFRVAKAKKARKAAK
ncbi:MAG: hypothetical protein ACKOBH_03965 [bacterium]